jgi:hypothetical protein
MTTYRIGDIRPNPFRNIDRYPINRKKVDELKASIGRTAFWDNLVARIGADDKPEIGYGHHRMVALRELFPPDHEISLIVRDLDDAAMLHVMADENKDDWAASVEVLKETVRAVRDFLVVSRPKVSTGGRPPENGSIADIAAFLGWPEWRVQDSLALINAEEAGILEPEDTDGLALDTAVRLQRSVAKIKEPEIKRAAVARVRGDLKAGRLAVRGIPDVVRQVREEYAPPPEPKVPAAIAKGIYADIDNFWRIAVHVNSRTLTRAQVVRLIAENRDAVELTVTTYGMPWAEQIALALDEMATTARSLAEVLRAENAVAVAS